MITKGPNNFSNCYNVLKISYISYFKHIYTGYKFNKDIVLQFGPVKIKVPNKLFTNKLIDKNIYIFEKTKIVVVIFVCNA